MEQPSDLYNKNLKELYYTNKSLYTTDKGTRHSYIDVYNKIFEKYKYLKINILEVGVQTGGSLKLWNDYFPNATIYGYDIKKTELVEKNITDRIVYRVQDFNKVEDCELVTINPTIAIDDGSHIIQHQLNFVTKVYPHLADGGILIVEDIRKFEDVKYRFDELEYKYELIDLRHIKNRFDDVLLIYKK